MTISIALPRAAEAWRPLMSSLGVRARLVGAYSFGAPQVEFTDAGGALQTCAVADLLIVADDLRGTGEGRRALLVRTAAAGAPSSGHADNAVQRELYEAWPAFWFRTRTHAEAPRTLTDDGGKQREPGCCAAIDLTGGSRWTFLEPGDGPWYSRLSLGTLLVQLSCGRAGRPAVRGGQDDWSMTVDELLSRTIRAAVARSPQLLMTTTFAGEAGTGHVLFENTTGLGVETSLNFRQLEGPISVVHLVLDTPPRAEGRAVGALGRAAPPRRPLRR